MHMSSSNHNINENNKRHMHMWELEVANIYKYGVYN